MKKFVHLLFIKIFYCKYCQSTGNNFTLFYNYAQAKKKLPKRPKFALVGAANALIAETSQNSMSPDEDGESSGDDGGGRLRQRAGPNGGEGGKDSQSEDDEKAPNIDLPKINLGSDPDFKVNVTSKR